MKKRNLKRKATAIIISTLVSFTVLMANTYIIDDFENRDFYPDKANTLRGKWELFDDNVPKWDMKTWDTASHIFTDEEGMLEGGNSCFTEINNTKITSDDISYKIIKNSNDTLSITKRYPDIVPTEGAGDDGDRALKLAFSLGRKHPQTAHDKASKKDGFVGFSTELAPENKFQPLSEDMEISFKAKVTIPEAAKSLGSEHLDVEFHLMTNQKVINLHDCTYRVQCKVNEDWQTFTYKLEFGKDSDSNKEPEIKFYQNNWWSKTGIDPLTDVYWGWECDKEEFLSLIEVDPNWSQSTKLQWIIKSPIDTSQNNANFVDQNCVIYVDDITITNFMPLYDDELTAEDAWAESVDETALLLYDSGSTNTIGGGNQWYPIGRTIEGDGTTTEDVGIVFNNGTAGVSFVLGDTFHTVIDDEVIHHFPTAGLAMNLYSDAVNKVGDFDATECNYNGIRFKYKTSENVTDWVQVRMRDNQVLKSESATFLVKIPATEGEWKIATVPFYYLRLPWWDTFDVGICLNQKNVRTLEFVYEGKPGQAGGLYLDDIYLVTNAEVNIPDIPIITLSNKEVVTSIVINSTYSGIQISLPESVESASIELYDLRGQRISSQIVDKMTNLDTNHLPAKIYILRAISLEGAPLDISRKISLQK